MAHLRKQPGWFYAYPSHERGVRGAWKRLLWRLGFDPLTVRQRLWQIRREADDWKRWGDESATAAYVAWGDGRPQTEWADAIQTAKEAARAEVRPGG